MTDVLAAHRAIVLAGRRPGAADPVAEAADAPCTALVPLGGEPLLFRVLVTLAAAGFDQGVVCGLAPSLWAGDVSARAGDLGFTWHRGALAGPSSSALAAIEDEADGGRFPVLVTAADHGLLEPATVRDFVSRAIDSQADFVIGMVSYGAVQAAFPAGRRTAVRFRDGALCGCNLFLVRRARGLGALRLWQTIEQHRKQPWRIAAKLGPSLLVRYLSARLDRRAAATRLGELAGCSIEIALLSDPTAAVDVDTVDDLALARRVVAERDARAS